LGGIEDFSFEAARLPVRSDNHSVSRSNTAKIACFISGKPRNGEPKFRCSHGGIIQIRARFGQYTGDGA
jgi:hypothetical protein